ncbi:adenosine receptor A1-like [Mytilus californianus]|uniref:adenosine receptor A1-like n=1 Tax=Mytilus californianus TaxID=6549 RepID=UPI002245F1C9|nr:adenosine receptor A1-like [Mytilus californianus]
METQEEISHAQTFGETNINVSTSSHFFFKNLTEVSTSKSFLVDNTTSLEEDYENLNKNLDVIFGVISLVITPLVIGGNALVIISLFKFRRLRTTTNMFIGSLALSDFLLGLLTLPMYALFYLNTGMNKWKYLCLFKYSSVILSMSSSLINLVVIAVDRYIAILHPLKYQILMTKQRAKKIIICVWIYHGIIGSLPSFGWNNYDKYNGTVCDFFVVLPQAYSLFTAPTTILVGLLISLYLYCHIYKVAREHNKKMVERKGTQLNRQFSKDTKSAKAMVIILFFFFIFWVPFMLAGPLKYVKIAKNLFNIIKNFALSLAMCNSAINPFMYCWLRKDFKCAFQDLIKNYICSKIPKPDWSSSTNNSEDEGKHTEQNLHISTIDLKIQQNNTVDSCFTVNGN